MKKKKADKIVALFKELEGNEPEKSTEYLFEMTVNAAAYRYAMEIDSSDVAEALIDHTDEEFSVEVRESMK